MAAASIDARWYRRGGTRSQYAACSLGFSYRRDVLRLPRLMQPQRLLIVVSE
jgi:hypothetical protein